MLPLAAATCVIVLALLGCDRQTEDSPTDGRGAQSSVSAAAADHFVQPTAVRSNRALPAVPPAPKPTASLPAGASCVTAECHASLLTAAHVHGPVGEKACNACHEDDIGGHRYPLKRGQVETCTFCHAVAGTATHQHAPLKEGCASCHDPHVSQTKFLLKADNVEQLCQKCHDVPLRKYAHEPFAKGQCTLCHEPHQGNNAMLLRGGEGKDHCFTCHGPMKQTLLSATSVHQPVMEACTTCHNPHSSDYPHELKAPVQQTCLSSGCHDKVQQHLAAAPVKHSAMTSDASCAACHNAHASAQPHLLADRGDQVCLTCHDRPLQAPDGRTIQNMKPVLTTSQFLHGPVRVGNCSACHDAHGGQHNALLSRSFPDTFYTRFEARKYDLCFTCHDSSLVQMAKTTALTNFRDGEVNLHFVHVNRDQKGRSCKTCHEIHGSNLPNHVAEAVPFEGSRWAMPIEYQPSASGGSCTPGCHDTKKYDRGGPANPAAGAAPTTRGAS